MYNDNTNINIMDINNITSRLGLLEKRLFVTVTYGPLSLSLRAALAAGSRVGKGDGQKLCLQSSFNDWWSCHSAAYRIRSGVDGACGVVLGLDVDTRDILGDEGANLQSEGCEFKMRTCEHGRIRLR